ncbi:hypothetical protein SODALDRAFT_376313 [Sodiomyces alkalinus F11]|uniref:Uncharacterized protein n=1 Tax=Sodiomyces alkalinus (strain CBS 110278 / VKM F-3762 / F11) TaxID=1314773 RepID=A0A3N2Q1E1_SODAK|nr:hypothetical protein SODALDRAFT_376313 [Sodiomyces alkalinus F11]ROT40526.1 hypothetical protein SODALDRAFT_376313 [Sodiomyces alkalinus F11]
MSTHASADLAWYLTHSFLDHDDVRPSSSFNNAERQHHFIIRLRKDVDDGPNSTFIRGSFQAAMWEGQCVALLTFPNVFSRDPGTSWAAMHEPTLVLQGRSVGPGWLSPLTSSTEPQAFVLTFAPRTAHEQIYDTKSCSISNANLNPMSYHAVPITPPRSPLRQRQRQRQRHASLPPRPGGIRKESDLPTELSEAKMAAIRGEKVAANLRALFDNETSTHVNRSWSSSSSYPQFRESSASSSDLPPFQRSISLGLAQDPGYHNGLHRIPGLRASSGSSQPLRRDVYTGSNSNETNDAPRNGRPRMSDYTTVSDVPHMSLRAMRSRHSAATDAEADCTGDSSPEINPTFTDVSPLIPAIPRRAPELRDTGGRKTTPKPQKKTKPSYSRPIKRKESTPRLYLRRAKSVLHTRRVMIRRWFKGMLRRDKRDPVPPPAPERRVWSSRKEGSIPRLAKRLSLFSLRSRKRVGADNKSI